MSRKRKAPQRNSITKAIKQARESLPHTLKIENEVDRLDQIPEALAAKADIILL